MAKTVSDVFLKLKVEGQQTLERLKSSFRGLEKTVDVTDKGIEQLRAGLKDYAKQTNNSTQLIKGQIDAFKALQAQATIGGKVYKQLGNDITELTKKLKQLEVQYNQVEESAKRSNKQLASEAVSKNTEKFAVQLNAVRTLLKENNVNTTAYTERLAELQIRQTAMNRVLERQAVIAAGLKEVTVAGAVQGRENFLEMYGKGLAPLPNTTAALGQQLKELRQDLSNLSIGGDRYVQTLREIDRVQKQIAQANLLADDPYGTAARKQRIRAGLGQQPVFGMFEGQDPVQKAIRRRQRRQARRAGPREVPAQVQEISQLYQQITDIGMSRTKGYIDAMGNSFRRVASDIREATAASNGSINSLNSQRTAWTTLRNSLNPASDAYREVSREIDKVDKKLSKLNRGGGMRRVGRNLAAGAGGMLSGGIFGGPEGAVGGLIGGLGFGPQGAIAGAAIGAQVSQLRQQVAGVAEFNAQITLAKTTLAQASTGLQDYNRLLGLARQVSSDYAVSLQPAISGLAQVATAARANNLSFDDTEKIYRGLIASNVAFGKSQEDLDAIIRATVQVLSKGKVSAEELSGQIGERLPGAVAKFAAANDMTLPQLTKAFKDGQVTIAQFVRFAAAQGEEYDEIAKKIAEGPEKAGLRLQIALENSGEIFGSFFAKVGAGFQDFFAQIVTFFNNNEKRVKLFITNMVNGALLVAGAIKQIVMGIVNFAKGALDILEKFNPLIKAVRLSFQKGLEDFYNKAPERMKGVADKFGIKLYSVEELFPDKTPTTFGKGGGGTTPTGADAEGEGDSKAARDLERRIAGSQEVVRRLRDQLEISKQQRPLDEFLAKQAKDRSDFEAKFAKLRGDKKNEQIEQAYIDAQALMQKKQEFDLQKFIFDKMKGIGDMKMEQMRLEQDLNRELQDRQYELGLISEEEYKRLQMVRERKRLEEQYPGEGFAGKRAEAEDLYRRQIDPTFKEAGETEVARMERDLEKMTKPLEQLKGAAMAFGESISTAFSNIVTGSQTAQQAMASFLKNLGQYFVEYAAKVITQMIAIATIQAVIKALGGPSTSGGAGADTSNFTPSNIGDNYSSFITNAGGNAFNKGLKRYAMGGVVNKPTMFTYAEGGTGRFGLMGEAGPEAIIPLKRGNDGRLGVSAYFADANAAMAKGAANRTSAAAFEENADALAMSSSYVRERSQERERQTMLTGAGGSMLIQTQVINNVEYATMDQVAQATAASAKQARAQVFADIRNKPATRSSLGMR